MFRLITVDSSSRGQHRGKSVEGRDPVTTDPLDRAVRWRSLVNDGICDRYQTPAPHPARAGKGGEIVCAAGNGGITCDVGSSHPGGAVPPKGWAVRPSKRYASWVQNVVKQFGLYPVWAQVSCEELPPVREDRGERTDGVRVVLPRALLGSYVRSR